MKVTVQVLPNNKARASVLDEQGKEVAQAPVKLLQKRGIVSGAEVPLSKLQRLAEREAKSIQNVALAMLTRASRSQLEFEKKLADRGFGQENITQITQKFLQLGYLNDEAYAKRRVEIGRARGYSNRRIATDLWQRGIDKALSQRVMGDPGQDEQACYKHAQKLQKKYEGLEARVRKQKIVASLARKGFSWETISKALGAQADDYEQESP